MYHNWQTARGSKWTSLRVKNSRGACVCVVGAVSYRGFPHLRGFDSRSLTRFSKLNIRGKSPSASGERNCFEICHSILDFKEWQKCISCCSQNNPKIRVDTITIDFLCLLQSGCSSSHYHICIPTEQGEYTFIPFSPQFYWGINDKQKLYQFRMYNMMFSYMCTL